MKTQDWEERHQAIKDLISFMDETIPTITDDSTAGSVFMDATALHRCNRLLRAVDNAVERGLGNTAGGNVRPSRDRSDLRSVRGTVGRCSSSLLYYLFVCKV